MAIFGPESRKIAENGCFWAKNPKYQKSGNVRPSGFPRHYLGQKIRRKYQFWKKLFKKLSFENGRFSLILARFRAKSPKTCQLRRPISQKRLNIFWFCKKFLAPHNQDYKICENKENLKFLLRPPLWGKGRRHRKRQHFCTVFQFLIIWSTINNHQHRNLVKNLIDQPTVRRPQNWLTNWESELKTHPALMTDNDGDTTDR